MYTPSSTYRLQLHQGFTLQQLQEILPYLHELGISTIYASPIAAATRGSTHGYDVTDPHILNPETGTLSELKEITTWLQHRGMGWIQDIVPNHMAFTTANTRLMDVLERDAHSPFYDYFDIQWKHPSFPGKLMVPFLGEELEEAIDRSLISLVLTDNGFYVQYGEQRYPLSLTAYSLILTLFGLLANEVRIPRDLYLLLDRGRQAAPWEEWKSHKRALFTRLTANARHRLLLESWLAAINQDKELITRLLETQYYELCHWQQVNHVINYRRFFTVSSLICTRVETAAVFKDYHQWPHALYREGLIQGLRIDHVDGLYDPRQYLQQLRDLFGDDCYMIVEKILERGEAMPADWPVQGESGYELLAAVNQVLTNRQGGDRLAAFYQSFVPQAPVYAAEVIRNKQQVLQLYMQGEWDNITRYYKELDLMPYTGEWRRALGILMAAMPVYRIYPGKLPLTGTEKRVLEEAFATALQVMPSCAKELNYLQELFCGDHNDPEETEAILLFLKRFMQFTGPVMAKGVEDTTFYTYNALLSHNEVGDSPMVLGSTIGAFHQLMVARQAAAPLALNATTTHDTKRGEDARMRINALTELPALWEEAVKSWFVENKLLLSVVDAAPAPLPNDEYFIYQAIVGGFPEDGLLSDAWLERFKAYMLKALREAQTKTNWQAPHEAYEQACMDFIQQLFHPEHSFVRGLRPLMERVDEIARVKALAHLLLKCTAPGIPDTYQGCELWDFSFVDPDNRRPVDYDRRKQFLRQVKAQELIGADALRDCLHTHRHLGMEKLFLTYKLLHLRKAMPDLFVQGSYLPLEVMGQPDAVIAYARQWQQQWILVIIPLRADQAADISQCWITLPPDAPINWTDCVTGEPHSAADNRLPLSVIGGLLPIAVLQQGP